MLTYAKDKIRDNLINLPGWRTNRKIVVFESDDWGMIRMSSRKDYQRLFKKGYPLDKCPYSTFDALESDKDLENLGEVLSTFQDRNGKPAIFTLNNIVANPDFAKIYSSDFRDYFFEPFTETLKKYPNSDRVLDLYKQGIEHQVFKPQFHGREHINVNRWMESLKKANPILRDAFEFQLLTLPAGSKPGNRRDFLDAFGLAYHEEIEPQKSILKSGLELFEKIWGYQSKSFIAPCYIWPIEIEALLNQQGIKYIQGIHVQQIPVKGVQLKIKRKYHHTGQQNQYKQIYIVRNVDFEPTENPGIDNVNRALRKIQIAFRYKKPAVISSHRLNYIGRIFPENREKNLLKLSTLIKQILSHWPDVEFMSTDQLGKIILS